MVRTAPWGDCEGHRRRRDRKYTDHNACEQTDSFATVGVRNHVSIANGKESDRDKPHRSQEVTGHILSVMVPEEK